MLHPQRFEPIWKIKEDARAAELQIFEAAGSRDEYYRMVEERAPREQDKAPEGPGQEAQKEEKGAGGRLLVRCNLSNMEDFQRKILMRCLIIWKALPRTSRAPQTDDRQLHRISNCNTSHFKDFFTMTFSYVN